jgi:hypothetical protein
LRTICQGWPRTLIWSLFQVASITGMSHWSLARIHIFLVIIAAFIFSIDLKTNLCVE